MEDIAIPFQLPHETKSVLMYADQSTEGGCLAVLGSDAVGGLPYDVLVRTQAEP